MQARKVTEKTTMDQIKSALQAYGWFVFRVPPSVYGHKGLCDLIAVKNSSTVFIEVKAPKGKQSEEQKVFESEIKNAGGTYVLARELDDVEWMFKFANLVSTRRKLKEEACVAGNRC